MTDQWITPDEINKDRYRVPEDECTESMIVGPGFGDNADSCFPASGCMDLFVPTVANKAYKEGARFVKERAAAHIRHLQEEVDKWHKEYKRAEEEALEVPILKRRHESLRKAAKELAKTARKLHDDYYGGAWECDENECDVTKTIAAVEKETGA